MGFIDRGMTGGYQSHNLGSITTSAGTESTRAVAPSGIFGPSAGVAGNLLQSKLITERYSVAEVWVPVGVSFIVTTGITVTNPVLQLKKNGVAPNGPFAVALSGIATVTGLPAAGPNEIFLPLTNWTFAAADAPGDAWSLTPITTSTAGVINPVYLWYGIRVVPGVSDGVSI